jgi:predicted permease
MVKARLASLYDEAMSGLATIPGVRSVAVSSRGILGNSGSGSPIRVPGYIARPTDDYYVGWNIVTPNFFETTGISLVAGRAFTGTDVDGSQRVAIISRSLAKHYFGTDNPIGKHFGIRIADDYPLEVVGVANDAVDLSLRADGVDMIYLPYRQDVEHMLEMCVVVRTNGPPSLLAEPVRRALHTVDSALPVLSVESMEGQVTRTLVQERLIALLAGLFGVLALSLASIGLYAIVAQSVATRGSELAVRVALGGSPQSIVSLILSESLSVVIVGIVAGIVSAQLAVRAISSQLFGVSRFDLPTLAAATLLMCAAAAVAAWVPALRAARTDPNIALRSQ